MLMMLLVTSLVAHFVDHVEPWTIIDVTKTVLFLCILNLAVLLKLNFIV